MKQILFALLTVAYSTFLSAQNYNIQFQSEMNFPNETVANIYGYTKDAHEYALVGGSQSTHIVDVTNPAAPVLVKSIPFVNSLWKEIRVYKNMAYVTSEGPSAGLQIIDLSPLPASTDLPTYRYYGDGAIAGQLQTIHALQIDTTKGFIYLYGSSIGNGGAIVCSLADPYNPVYAGRYDLDYIHDGYADNDTLYGGHIGAGYFSVIDMSNKTNPVVLATQTTPTAFTHNTWLTKDRKHLLTTDETSDSYLTMYDISDLSDIKELDRLQCTPGSGSIVHNTYVKDDYAVTAWYTDGVNIVDCTRPGNMVQTGWYDTYPGTGSAFEGAWGVYPYFPSGNLIVSNMNPGKIFMLTPTYTRAAYVEGNVTNAQTGAPIPGAKVSIQAANPLDTDNTDNSGAYQLGHYTAGPATATCYKAGYITQVVNIELVAGELVVYNFELESAPTFTLSGKVTDANNTPIPNVKIAVHNPEIAYNTTTDAAGNYSINNAVSATYDIFAGIWGYKNEGQIGFDLSGNSTADFVLEKGYKDDFAVDQGWTISGTSTQGIFERVEPKGIFIQGIFLTPETDILTDLGDQCYVTGNNGINFVDDDVLNGNTILTSPVMDLTGYLFPQVRFSTAFISASSAGELTTDKMQVFMSNGTTQKLIYTRSSSFTPDWKVSTILLPSTLPLTNTMTLRVEVSEAVPGENIVTEGAFDGFEVIGTSGTQDLLPHIALSAQPNPFNDAFMLTVPEGINYARAVVVNVLGQVVESVVVEGQPQYIELGSQLGSGIYFVSLYTAQGVSPAIKVIKE